MDIPVRTRPIRLDDEARFRRLWPRLSLDTRYRRFHSPVPRLPDDLVHRLVDVDHDDREAVVAVVGDEVVAVARYDRSPADPTTADFAIVVEDAWQGVGLGRQLLTEVVALAARRGVRTATASVQMDNDRILGLLRRVLPGSRVTRDSGLYAVSGPLPVRRSPSVVRPAVGTPAGPVPATPVAVPVP